MCKEHILMWLSGAAGLDAVVHLLSGFGWNWYGRSANVNFVLFVVFGLAAMVLGYMAVCESRGRKKKK